jgi:MFS family permease
MDPDMCRQQEEAERDNSRPVVVQPLVEAAAATLAAATAATLVTPRQPLPSERVPPRRTAFWWIAVSFVAVTGAVLGFVLASILADAFEISEPLDWAVMAAGAVFGSVLLVRVATRLGRGRA